MKIFLSLVLLIFCALAMAEESIYVCVDEDGTRTYQDFKGKGKNCKKLDDLPRINSMPAPKLPAKNVKQMEPAGFPKVDERIQRERDNDRRKILEEELKTEQEHLLELQKEYNNGQPERQGDERNYQKYLDRVERLKSDIDRSEKNIEALQKEINKLKNS